MFAISLETEGYICWKYILLVWFKKSLAKEAWIKVELIIHENVVNNVKKENIFNCVQLTGHLQIFFQMDHTNTLDKISQNTYEYFNVEILIHDKKKFVLDNKAL